eukprot:COSAG05_NODE_4448_length_1510_cov_1.542169_1_plen_415_part_10
MTHSGLPQGQTRTATGIVYAEHEKREGMFKRNFLQNGCHMVAVFAPSRFGEDPRIKRSHLEEARIERRFEIDFAKVIGFEKCRSATHLELQLASSGDHTSADRELIDRQCALHRGFSESAIAAELQSRICKIEEHGTRPLSARKQGQGSYPPGSYDVLSEAARESQHALRGEQDPRICMKTCVGSCDCPSQAQLIAAIQARAWHGEQQQSATESRLLGVCNNLKAQAGKVCEKASIAAAEIETVPEGPHLCCSCSRCLERVERDTEAAAVLTRHKEISRNKLCEGKEAMRVSTLDYKRQEQSFVAAAECFKRGLEHGFPSKPWGHGTSRDCPQSPHLGPLEVAEWREGHNKLLAQQWDLQQWLSVAEIRICICQDKFAEAAAILERPRKYPHLGRTRDAAGGEELEEALSAAKDA